MEAVLEKVIKEVPDCLVEACFSSEESLRLNFENNSFNGADSGFASKLEVRVSQGQRSGYAWTSDSSKWKECVLRAKKLMLASSPLRISPLLSSDKGVNKSFIHSNFNKINANDLMTLGIESISKCRSLNVNVPEMIIEKKKLSSVFLNSSLNGFSQENGGFSSEIQCSINDSSAGDGMSRVDGLSELPSFSERVARLALDSLRPKSLGTGVFDVVLDFNAINSILQVLLPSLMANNVVEGKSFLSDKQGSLIASDLLSITDVPVIEGSINNSLFDDEGVRIAGACMINKGVLDGFINDLYSSSCLNVLPSGNSGGLIKRGIVSVNNLVINEGDLSYDDLLNDCVFINQLMGNHTANTVSGDFALSALNAFKISNGKRLPVRDLMLSGNVFDLISKVKGLSKNSRLDFNLKTPLIKFSKVQLVS